MRLAGVTLVLLASLAIVPASAQDAPVRVADAVSTDSIRPSHLAEARALIRLLRLEETGLAAGMQVFDQQSATNPDAGAFRDIVEEWMRGVFGSEEAEIAFARAYAEVLTEQEIVELIAFYRSPIGARLAVLQPTLAAKGAAVGQQLAAARQADLEARIMARAAELEGAITE